MDLKEFTSPGPKPWLIIDGAQVVAPSNNGASGTVQTPFSATAATNVMPLDVPSACYTIQSSECKAGMAFRVNVYGHVQTAGGADLGVYLAQDNGAVALTNTTGLHFSGATDTEIRFELTLVFPTLGAAATAKSLGYSNYTFGSSPNILVLSNTTTCHTNTGLSLGLFMQWGAGGNNIVIKQVLFERLY